jgi:hypothetical protein
VESIRRQDRLVADPERVVVECCAARTPAVVTFVEVGPGLRAVFVSFRNERIELELIDPGLEAPAAGGICHVSFVHRGQPVTFTSTVRDGAADGDRLRVGVGVPGHIVADGLRSAFRIPGAPGTHQVDVVGDDGVAWQAELVNLSLTGMLVSFAGEGPTLLPDQVVEISVKVDDEHVRLAGVVRRVDDDGVGIFFPDAVSSDAPENPIRRAVAALERDWHARMRR